MVDDQVARLRLGRSGRHEAGGQAADDGDRDDADDRMMRRDQPAGDGASADRDIGPRLDPAGARAHLVVLSMLGQRSEEHTPELPSLMRISSAVFCLNNKTFLLSAGGARYRLQLRAN